MLKNELNVLIALAFMVSMISLTVTRSRLFKGFRDWVDEITCGSNVNSSPSMWYELIKCPFCFSFWITGVSIPIFFRLWRINTVRWDQLTVTFFAVWGLSCIFSGAILKLFEQGSTLRND